MVVPVTKYSPVINTILKNLRRAAPVSDSCAGDPARKKDEAASSSNLPLRTDLGEGRSTPPENADDSGDYAILQESDNSEVQEKKETKKHETNENAERKMLMKINPKPGANDECDTTLPLRTTYVPRPFTEHFHMTPPGQNAKEGPPRSPPGLGLVEFPSLESNVPSRRDIRAIAKRNMMALFGQEVMLLPNTNRVLLSAQSSDDDVGLEDDMNMGWSSDQIVHPEGWQSQGSLWRPRGGIASDPGAGKSARADMVSFSRAVSEVGVRGKKPENKKEEQEYSSKREGYSPLPGTLKEQAEAKRGSPSKHRDPDLDHAPDHVHCAAAKTTPTTTSTSSLKSQPSGPRLPQGLKVSSPSSSAALDQGITGGNVRREPLRPSGSSMSTKTSRNVHGGAAKPNKLVDEADGAAGTLSCVPVDEDLSGSSAHYLPRGTYLGDGVRNPVGADLVSFSRADEAQPQGIQEERR